MRRYWVSANRVNRSAPAVSRQQRWCHRPYGKAIFTQCGILVLDSSHQIDYTCDNIMEVCFEDDDLERLEADDAYTAGLPQAVVKAFRKRMQHIRAAVDERDIRSWASLHFEKLSGKRRGQHSMRLNDQYRLIIEVESTASKRTVRIIKIEDYH